MDRARTKTDKLTAVTRIMTVEAAMKATVMEEKIIVHRVVLLEVMQLQVEVEVQGSAHGPA